MEQIPFPNETIQNLHPDLVETWTVIGVSHTVPWQSVVVMVLSLGTFLSPTAVLMPTTTMKIFPVLWNFLIHPCSTHTSNLIAVCRDAFDSIEAAVSSERTKARLEWRRQYPRVAEERNPFSGKVSMSGASGSLEGEGKQMALPQNLGRSCSLMSSRKRLIMCLHNEGSLNESIVVELHEHAKWKRTTVDGTRSFTIPYPFFGAARVIHPQDVAKLYLEDDPLVSCPGSTSCTPCPRSSVPEKLRLLQAWWLLELSGWKPRSLSDVFMRVHGAVFVKFLCNQTPLTFISQGTFSCSGCFGKYLHQVQGTPVQSLLVG